MSNELRSPARDRLAASPTGRNMVIQHLDNLIAGQRRGSTTLCCLLIRLDNLRDIKLALGYDCIMDIIAQVKDRLASAIRADDRLLPIDEKYLALLLPNLKQRAQGLLACRRIADIFSEPFTVAGRQVRLHARLGLADTGAGMDSGAQLMLAADRALERAITNNSEFEIHSPDLDDCPADGLLMEHELRQALARQELAIHYQPKIEMTSGFVVSAEALMRWSPADGKPVSPEVFIPVAEASGLITDLTRWLINQSCKQLNTWYHRDGIYFKLAINLSPSMLVNADIVDYLDHCMGLWDIHPEQLTLEITENALMNDPGACLEQIVRLHRLGLQFSIDDFGTGYSSLAYLKRLPVDEIKIDKSFILNMDSDENDRTIARSVIDLGHNFGLRVVAEGIETAQVFEQLRAMGCDLGQGYHMSRPLPAAGLEQWFADSPWVNPDYLKRGRNNTLVE